MFPFPFLVSSSEVSLSYITHAEQTADGTSFTLSSVSIGTAASNRRVLIGVWLDLSGSGASISSVTIGGVTATQHAAVSSTGSGVQSIAAIYSAALASGTTADIVVTVSATSLRCGAGVWAMYGSSSTAYATATDAQASSALTASLTVPVHGAAVAVCGADTGATPPTYTWSQMTERFDSTIEGGSSYSGADVSGAASLSITATPSAGIVRSLAAASFAPA